MASAFSGNFVYSAGRELEELRAGKEDDSYSTHEKTVSWAELLTGTTSRSAFTQDMPKQKGNTANCLLVLHVAGDLRSTRSAMESFCKANIYQTVQLRSALLRVSSKDDPLQNRPAGTLGPAEVKQCLTALLEMLKLTRSVSNLPLGWDTLAAINDCYRVCDALAPLQETVQGQMVPLLRCFESRKSASLCTWARYLRVRCG